MNKEEEKKKDGQKSKEKEEEKKNQIKLRVFEEDDYFEEFEVEQMELARVKSEDMRKWQANWEDEEINDNFESLLKQELTKNGQKLT
jgi:hypothetical protein